EVFATHLRRVHAQLCCDKIKCAFHDVSCFGTAGAAICVSGHLVCEARGDVHLDCGDLVSAGEHQSRQGRNRGREQLVISAHVCEDAVTQSEHGAVVLYCDFDIANLAASMDRRLDVFTPRFDPLNWFPELHRDPTEERFFRVDIQLGSKATTD